MPESSESVVIADEQSGIHAAKTSSNSAIVRIRVHDQAYYSVRYVDYLEIIIGDDSIFERRTSPRVQGATTVLLLRGVGGKENSLQRVK